MEQRSLAERMEEIERKIEETLDRCENILIPITDQVKQVTENSTHQIEEKLEQIQDHWTTSQSTRIPPPTQPLTYAAAVSQRVPNDHNSTIEHSERKTRQILIDGVPTTDNEGKELTEEKLVEKAQKVLELMEDGETAPDGMRFRSAIRIRNGGLLLELNSKEAAAWLQRPHVMKTFIQHFDLNARLKTRQYPVLAEFVPLNFDPQSRAHIEAVEMFSETAPGDILGTSWIKPPERRSERQKTAHLIVRFCSPEAANRAIGRGLVITGKKIRAQKLLQEACRCLKCQKIGVPHMARDCPEQTSTCGTCGSQQHEMHECSITDPSSWFCVNCNRAGHTS